MSACVTMWLLRLRFCLASTPRKSMSADAWPARSNRRDSCRYRTRGLDPPRRIALQSSFHDLWVAAGIPEAILKLP
jgi:hypothetical protein